VSFTQRAPDTNKTKRVAKTDRAAKIFFMAELLVERSDCRFPRQRLGFEEKLIFVPLSKTSESSLI